MGITPVIRLKSYFPNCCVSSMIGVLRQILKHFGAFIVCMVKASG
jgi:hypothetical protein